jgi:hypothetical protein
MSIKFKPGPWLFYPRANWTELECITDLKGQAIARTNNEANARLIAAAPDLYVAALKALDIMKTGPEKDALVEALLKATAGEAK